MKIADLKKKFKNTWVLAEVLKEDKLNRPLEVKPILSSRNKNKIYAKISELPKDKVVTTFFTGKLSGSFLL